jgi:hypothetical protein
MGVRIRKEGRIQKKNERWSLVQKEKYVTSQDWSSEKIC